MSAKSVLRLLLGVFLAAVLLAVALPAVGIPRSHYLPPPMIYNTATGKTTGVVTGKIFQGTRNPFAVGEKTYWVGFRFAAKVPPALGVQNVGKIKTYKASVNVEKVFYDRIKIGDRVPVKFEKTYPDICGINLKNAGRSSAAGSSMISGWMLYAALTLVLGYAIAPLIQRLFLREDY